MFQKIRDLLPANRVAAITGFLTSITLALVALQTSFIPGSPPAEAIAKAIAFLGSVLAAWKIVDKFLDGSQNWDSLLLSGQPKNSGGLVTTNATAEVDAGEDAQMGVPELGALGAVAEGEAFPTIARHPDYDAEGDPPTQPPGLRPGA